MTLGNNIKKRRYELKMSQQELANAMGYKTRSTIAKIESGENDVSQKKLQKLANVLHTTPEALMSGYSDQYSNIEMDLPRIESKKENKNIVIILAGGKSGRNRQNIPSQFLNVHGKPIIVYCMEVYQRHPSVDEIYIACLKGWENIVEDYANRYGITKLKKVVTGGNCGIASLKNAIDSFSDSVKNDDFVIIQESTRPMVNTEMISKVIQAGRNIGSVTMCHTMNEYVQFGVSKRKAEYIDRNSIVALQSPEGHFLSTIRKVFETAQEKGHSLSESCFTMLMYNLEFKINFIESGKNNIKITYEEDIAAFSVLAREQTYF